MARSNTGCLVQAELQIDNLKIFSISLSMSQILGTHQIFTKVKVLGHHVFDTPEHFSQTEEYDEIGWLLLVEQETVGKGKGEFRTPKYQLRLCIMT